jgi:prepilin-type N-terminal cleavage/methylation domain-containing protein
MKKISTKFRQFFTRGFTVLELLIVIAIIGILATVVIVSVNDARVKAKNAKIDLHVREYVFGFNSFIAKNGRLPYTTDCQATGIPSVGNGGTLGVCLGQYEDEGFGPGCGFYLKTTESYSTFEDPLLNQELLLEMGVLPPLPPIPMNVPSEFEYLLQDEVRGAMYICTDFAPDGSVTGAWIRYFKIKSNQGCLGGATYDPSFDFLNISTCLYPIRS